MVQGFTAKGVGSSLSLGVVRVQPERYSSLWRATRTKARHESLEQEARRPPSPASGDTGKEAILMACKHRPGQPAPPEQEAGKDRAGPCKGVRSRHLGTARAKAL